MRKAGPILILLIGIFALLIDFFPNLQLPDSQSADGTWRTVVTKLGLDLEGGLRVEYQALPVEGKAPTPGDMGVIKDIVERRVNTTGVSEPVVTTQGADRVVVELPGVTDPEAVRKLVGQTGRLDFVPLGSTQATEGQQLDLKQYPPLFSGDQVASATVGTDQNGRPSVDWQPSNDKSLRACFGQLTRERQGTNRRRTCRCSRDHRPGTSFPALGHDLTKKSTEPSKQFLAGNAKRGRLAGEYHVRECGAVLIQPLPIGDRAVPHP